MYRKFFKRFFDICFSLLMLPMFTLLFIIVAPLIYFEDRNSVFFVSKRVGKNGKLFKMYKFRTMIKDAPDIRLEDGSTFNSENDPRVTKVGNFLRKTSLDEVPQLINVLVGEMSFVGPRPDPPDWLERYPEEYKAFLEVQPGITGYSQAYFRNSADGILKMKNDLFYSLNYSFVLDVKIIWVTVFSVLKKENLYKE